MRKSLIAAFSALALTTAAPAAMAAPGDFKGIENAVDPHDTNVALPNLQFFSVETEELEAVGAHLALSMFNANGEPVIFYDEETLAQYPQEFQTWLYLHEQAHFTNEDFSAQESMLQKSMGYRSGEDSHEAVADCTAVQNLRDIFRYSEAQIQIVADTVAEVFEGGEGSTVKAEQGFGYAHKFAYPSGQDRAANILKCYRL
jgi:hypothetical protein